jgi:PDZ domain-containing secreted protein
MHKTIASKSGGSDVNLTPQQEAAQEADWKKNAEEQAAKAKAEAEELALADAGFDTLAKDLPPDQAAALKKCLNL